MTEDRLDRLDVHAFVQEFRRPIDKIYELVDEAVDGAELSQAADDEYAHAHPDTGRMGEYTDHHKMLKNLAL